MDINISGRWRVICASHWTLANANVVCHQLSCGVAIYTPKGAEGNDQLWKAQYHCLGNESFLWEYAVTALGGPDCSHGNMASVICSGKREKGYWYPGCSWSEMVSRAESEGKLAPIVRYSMVKYGSSYSSFIFQVRAKSMKGNNIFLNNSVIYTWS